MKTSVLSVVLVTLLTTTCLAQSADQAKPKKTGNEWHAAGEAIPRSKEFADRVTKALALNESTHKKVYSAYLANTKAVDEIKLGGDSEADKKVALASNLEAFNQTMKGILTAEQYKKYLQLEPTLVK